MEHIELLPGNLILADHVWTATGGAKPVATGIYSVLLPKQFPHQVSPLRGVLALPAAPAGLARLAFVLTEPAGTEREIAVLGIELITPNEPVAIPFELPVSVPIEGPGLYSILCRNAVSGTPIASFQVVVRNPEG